MSAAGIRVNWDGAGASYAGIVVAGANRFDFTNEDFTITGWMAIKGDKPGTSSSSEGQVFCWVADAGVTGAHFRVRAIDSDNTFEHSPWEIVCRYMDTSFAQADVGTTGDVVATDEAWFYAVTWNHSTQALTYYRVKDGQTLASSSASGLSLLANLDTIRLGANDSTTRGGNLEIRTTGVWKRLHNSTEIDAQRHSATPVISSGLWAFWPLASAADTSDSSGNGRTLTMTGTVTDGAMDPVDLQPAGPATAFRGRRMYVRF